MVLANIVNRQDVRVIERGDGPSLLFETAQPLGVTRKRFRQDLERDLAS